MPGHFYITNARKNWSKLVFISALLNCTFQRKKSHYLSFFTFIWNYPSIVLYWIGVVKMSYNLRLMFYYLKFISPHTYIYIHITLFVHICKLNILIFVLFYCLPLPPPKFTLSISFINNLEHTFPHFHFHKKHKHDEKFWVGRKLFL